jgi:hypothetical protein
VNCLHFSTDNRVIWDDICGLLVSICSSLHRNIPSHKNHRYLFTVGISQFEFVKVGIYIILVSLNDEIEFGKYVQRSPTHQKPSTAIFSGTADNYKVGVQFSRKQGRQERYYN